MINTEAFFKKIKIHTNFFAGVPDSVLKNFTNLLSNSTKHHIIAPNEGSAISIGLGYYLSKKKVACVYMQNSGLGNALNPLISLIDKRVYSIPMVLIIGWRGAPNTKDEPQHKSKGKITKDLLRLLKIKFYEINSNKDLNKIDLLFKYSKNKSAVSAILIKNKYLNKVNNKYAKSNNKYHLKRSKFIEDLLSLINKNDLLISTTGYTSRELFQIRKNNNINNGKDFYMVGGMGHSLSTSIGLANKTKKKVICLDGDGSLLMHLGSMHLLNSVKPKNLKHILINNNSHESVGGQKTNAFSIDFKKLTKSFGYKNYLNINNKKDLKKKIKYFLKKPGPSFLEVKVQNGFLEPLTRPTSFIKIKNNFTK